MVLKTINSLLFLILLTTAPLLANPTTDFEVANAAYQKGDYTTAITQYESILKTDTYSEGLYYNLGNAYFKTNNLGKAILYYEKALLAAPRDADVLHNLEIARAKTKDDLSSIGEFFLAAWWQSIHKSLSAGVWGVLTLLSLWAGLAGLIVWLLAGARTQKKQGFIGGIALILLSVLLYFLGNSQANFEQNSRSAIVLAKSIELKNGPDAQSSAVINIHEGLKVELLDQIGDWYKVKLRNGDEGWLPMSSLEEI